MNSFKNIEDYLPTKELEKVIGNATKEVSHILHGALEGKEVSVSDGTTLFEQSSMQAQANRKAIYATADLMRARVNGERVSFVINRNINFTNVCYMGCRFCGFAKRKRMKTLNGSH